MTGHQVDTPTPRRWWQHVLSFLAWVGVAMLMLIFVVFVWLVVITFTPF